MDKNNQINEKLKKYVKPESVNGPGGTALQIYERRFRWLERTTLFFWLIYLLSMGYIWAVRGAKNLPMKYHSILYGDHEIITVMFYVIADYIQLVVKPLLAITIFMTILLYIKSRTLSIRKINARLSSIEEQLKEITASPLSQKD